MADTLQFDLVSPERRLASVQATEVRIPGADGDLTAMPDHAPVITTLRPGILSVVHGGTTDAYVVSGGFAEITGAGVSVLAEEAMAKSEITQAALDRLVAAAREHLAQAQAAGGTAADDAAKTLADMVAMGTEAGLSAG